MSFFLNTLRRFFERHVVLGLLAWGACYGAIFLALHPKLIDGDSFLGWDVVRQAWPNLEYFAGCLARGEFPLWTPYDKGGFAFVADPETALFYPVTWAMAALTTLMGHAPTVMLVQVLVHIAIAALGMHVFLARHQVSTGPRVYASIAYILSMRLAKSKDQTVLGTSVWLPWMAIAVEEVVRRPSWRTGLLLGSVLGIDLLAGYPPNFFRNILAVGVVFAFELAATWPRIAARRAHLLRLAQALGVAALVTAGLTAPVLAGLTSFEETARAQMSLAHVIYSSLRPTQALGVITPSWTNPPTLALYAGLPSVLFALVAMTRLERRRVGWAVAAVVFFLLACGGRASLLPTLVEHVPGFGLFRVPEQYLFPATFFFCLLVGHGFEDLIAAGDTLRDKLRLRAFLITVALLVVTLAALFRVWRGGGDVLDPRRELAFASFFFAVAAGYLAWVMTSTKRHWRVAAVVVAPLLLLADLDIQGRTTYDVAEPWPTTARDVDLASLKGVERDYRLVDEEHFEHRVGLRRRVRDFFGRQTALISLRYQRYVNTAKRDHRLLAAANVRYYAAPGQQAIWRKDPRHVKELASGILELEDAAPLAYWTARTRIEAGANNALGALKTERPGMAAVFERADLTAAQAARLAPPLRVPAMPVAARVLELAANRLELTIDAPAAGVLVINEKYAPGWKALVDDQPATILRANYLFRALLVGPGAHRVTMLYRPRGILIGIVVWAVTALAAVAAGLLLLWRRKGNARTKQTP